jgi:hypothetical protein
MTGYIFPEAMGARRHLRLVTKQPQPRRLEVRIAAADGRSPFGRSRAFRLTQDDLDELIAVAMRIERRS